MLYRKLGKTGLEISTLGYGAWGIGGTMWIGADDDESLRALRQAIELGVNFIDTAHGYGNGHSEELVGQVVARLGRDRLRGDEDPAEEPALAGAGRCPRRGCVPRGLGRQVHRGEPRAARRRDDRRAAVPRLVGRVGRPRRLARRRRAAEARRQDPLLRRLDQRPPACERGQAGRVGPRRHRPGDLQHLRSEPRGRAVPGGRGGRRGRDRARPVRRGRRSPGASVPTRSFRRATSATTTSATTGGSRSGTARRRSLPTSGWRSTSWPTSRFASASPIRPSRARSPACAR